MFIKDYFATAMLALLVYYSLVENVFHRQMGRIKSGSYSVAVGWTCKHMKTETNTDEFL